jgi:hypothetical protein
MKKFNNIVFTALYIIAWVIFVGLSIEAGGLIVNFVFSIFKPAFVGNLYQKLDLSKMYQQSKWVFYGIYSFVLFIAVLKAVLFYSLIDLLHKIDLAKPFSNFVSQKIIQISYYTFSIGIFSHIAKELTKYLSYNFEIDKLNQFWEDSGAYILMSAVVYVIAAIFKKGIDIQNENDLTV